MKIVTTIKIKILTTIKTKKIPVTYRKKEIHKIIRTKMKTTPAII